MGGLWFVGNGTRGVYGDGKGPIGARASAVCLMTALWESPSVLGTLWLIPYWWVLKRSDLGRVLEEGRKEGKEEGESPSSIRFPLSPTSISPSFLCFHPSLLHFSSFPLQTAVSF